MLNSMSHMQMQERRTRLVHTSEYISRHKLQQQALPAGILLTNNPWGHDGTNALVTLIYSQTVMRVRVQRSPHIAAPCRACTMPLLHPSNSQGTGITHGLVTLSHSRVLRVHTPRTLCTCLQHVQACTAEPATSCCLVEEYSASCSLGLPQLGLCRL